MLARNQIMQRVGELLYSEQWASALARDLEVHPRSLRRWCAGTAPIPDGVMDEMKTMLALRCHDIQSFLTNEYASY